MQRLNAFKSLLPLGLVVLVTAAVRGDGTTAWSLVSPNGACRIAVHLSEDGRLSYEASRDGKNVILNSPLGLRCNDQDFEQGLSLTVAGPVQSRREKYRLFAGPQPVVNHRLSFRRLTFHNSGGARLEIDLAVSDDGVAFRYRFPETNAAVRVAESELTGFQIATNARGWLQPYHAAGPYTPAYEDFYFPVSPGDPPPDSRARAVGWAFPALFHIPGADAWVLLTESGTDEAYCGCHLGPDAPGGRYRIAFPLANEATGGYTNQYGPEPRFALPWTMPWRVIIMSQSATSLATETLVTDLAAPSRVADTAWIKPGRASWAWWSYPDGPATTNLFDEFSDFAVKMGWEYTLFDAGWWQPGLPPITRHALAEGVRPLAWMHAGDFYSAPQRLKRLDEMAAAGVCGVKVDFWCSDRQEAMAAQQALMRDAAARHLLVNLHGCSIPRGWERTWPNFITCEAVLGCESYFFEPRYTDKAAELDAVLPFTRNAIGPMDLTPVACSPKKYARLTTAAHQLAAAIIFTSGIIHYADSPQFFESLPTEAQEVFREAPALWDETHCLIGDPGRVAVFARRAGDRWFIAGINGTTNDLPVTLDLSPYQKCRRRIAVTEGGDARMEVKALTLENSATWQHTVPPRGGFILRLQP